ncbi:MAG: phosphoribosylformylglycinamidine synthase [Halobacteriovoraceae bacterium]|nr:phosphoribosylformylglycinamidine synthase [Halobacteriovoraceae bacterium]
MKTWRIEVYSKDKKIKSHMGREYLKGSVTYIESNDFTIEDIKQLSKNILCNSLYQIYFFEEKSFETSIAFPFYLDKKFKFGVTDNTAHAIKECISLMYSRKKFECYTGEIYLFSKDPDFENFPFYQIGNKLLHQFQFGSTREDSFRNRFANAHTEHTDYKFTPARTILFDKNIEQLMEMSLKNCWALSREELQHIQKYYNSESVGLKREKVKISRNPTDVELEIIAQTWSEHCKHKIFSAEVDYSESENLGKRTRLMSQKIDSLYKSKIKAASFETIEKHAIDWAISLFKDNAGIVRFDPQIDLCAKVETHNSPSALDPYGGALTGILGVNRDILGCGMGSLPIANTDVFCVGSQYKMNENNLQLPANLLDPQTILDGIHLGVKDGGNKSGIPTVNGAICFDDDYMGKPLVFCGTIGTLPPTLHGKPSSKKPYHTGDLIVMVGGRVGMDGIHGATFSSLGLDENSPSSAVQIGDPFTQKRMTDFIIEARDRGLYTGITDNGAGGLSSSVGEMAEKTHGAQIDLAKVPLKYPGLSPYQVMVSESQERMTVAVSTKQLSDFLNLSKKYNVESTVIGKFTDSGFLEIFYNEKIVAYLNLDFLHNSLPQMKLNAYYSPEEKRNFWHNKDLRKKLSDNHREVFLNILSSPNVRSKEKYVRQYDCEVKASTVVKPFNGKKQTSPSDSSTVWLENFGGSPGTGVNVSCGLAPQYSYYDTYLMAQIAVDEAIRNALCSGANPEKMALLDNFCWPDPIESNENPQGSYRLAQLVRACEGLYQACLTFGTPLISGKDSMKNNFYDKQTGTEIAIAPTLLVTNMAYVEDISLSVTTSFKKANDHLYLLSAYNSEELFSKTLISQLSSIYHTDDLNAPLVDLVRHRDLYQKIYRAMKARLFSSCHDISDGGMITAITECCFGNHLGANVDLSQLDYPMNNILFNEFPASFIVSIHRENQSEFEKSFANHFTSLGSVQSHPRLKINKNAKILLDMGLLELETYWRNDNVF